MPASASTYCPPSLSPRSLTVAARLCLMNLDPRVILRRFQDRVRHVVRRETFAEGGRRAAAICRRDQEIGRLMNKRMLVADLKPRHPPVAHIRMIAIGDMQAAPSAQLALIAMIEPLQAMEIVQVPRDRCVLTVDLQGVQSLMAARITCRLECG